MEAEDLVGYVLEGLGVEAEIRGSRHGLPAEFEQDPAVSHTLHGSYKEKADSEEAARLDFQGLRIPLHKLVDLVGECPYLVRRQADEILACGENRLYLLC